MDKTKIKKAIAKRVKKLSTTTIIALICILTMIVGIWSVKSTIEASNNGKKLASLVAKPIGTIKGQHDGKKDGSIPNVDDTTIKINEAFKQTKKLEVLKANSTLHGNFSNNEKLKYTGVYLFRGEVIFSIDLTDVQVEYDKDGNIITITIPNPSADFHIDDELTKKLANDMDIQFWNKSENGYDAYIEVRKDAMEKIKENLVDYEGLMTLAKNSAKKQVEYIVKSTNVTGAEINVILKEESKND